MTWPVSARWVAASRSGATLLNEVTVETPDGEPVPLTVSAATVTKTLSAGARWTASMTVAPRPGQSTFSTVTTPGALFRLWHGYRYGAQDSELIPLGEYVLSRNAYPLRDQISLDLTDRWQTLEQSRFTKPYAPASTSRPGLVVTLVTGALPGHETRILTEGGSYGGGSVWESSRTEAINQLATDGDFLAYFAADGAFEVAADPILSPGRSAWTFTDGTDANIVSLTREIPFDRMYNTVVVRPVDESQTWAQVEVSVTDPTHPRHPDRLGVIVPYFYSSPTITSAMSARATALSILARVINTSSPLSVESVNVSHLEPGDTITVATLATETDEAHVSDWLVEAITHNLLTGATSVTARSSDVPDMEETA